MERRTRRGFTPEFKADTVTLVLQEGKTVAAVVRDLDLTESSVRAWVKQATIDAGRGLAGAPTTAEQEELARLRRENRPLRMERDLLKQAAAFFAKANG